MVASLKFESAAGTAAATLAEVKLVTLADNTDNKYTLDITTDDLKVAYTPNGGQAKEYKVNGLATALGKLLTIDGSTSGKSVLAEEVAKKPVVEAIFNAQDLTDPANPINFAETKIGATFAKKTDLDNKADKSYVNTELAKKANTADVYTKAEAENTFLKTTELKTKAAEKAVVEAIFDAKDLTDPANPINFAETKIGATFAKIDGSNVEEAGVIAMLGKLTPANQVAKIDGSNVEEAGVNTMLGKLTDKVVKTSELSVKAADKAVVEAIFNAQDLTDPANPINFAETKIGATFAKKTDLDNKADANGTNLDDAKVTAILEKLTDKVVKTSELSAKTAAKPVVDAITASADFTNKVYIKAASTDEVYTKTAADAGFAKIDASNLTDAANQKAFAEAILPAKDGQKSILINKLGEALDRVTDDKATDKVYGAKGSEKIAKDFLADKGLKPTPEDVATELAKNAVFQASAKIAVNAQDAGFQEAVKAVMSQPSFEIPIDQSTPLSWDF